MMCPQPDFCESQVTRFGFGVCCGQKIAEPADDVIRDDFYSEVRHRTERAADHGAFLFIFVCFVVKKGLVNQPKTP